MRTLAFLGLLLVLTLAACGGDDDTNATASSTAAASTRADYIADGDALCEAAQQDALALLAEAQELQGQSDTLPREEFLSRAADFWGSQIDFAESFRGDFAALAPPAGDEEDHQAFLATLDDGIATAHEIQDTLAGGEDVPAELTERYGRSVSQGNRLAREYGFKVCGSQTG